MCNAPARDDIFVFFFNDTATTEIYTLSLHDALPILENSFRHLAGQAGYEGGFIEHYVTPLVYPGVMPERWGLIAGFSVDRKSTRLNSSQPISRMPSSA